MTKIDEIRQRFRLDRFATECAGAEVAEAEPGRSVCRLTLRPEHMNGNNVPMGGVVFTLADFAFAVAVNGYAEDITVTQGGNISFLAPAKGKELIATATCVKSGRSTSLFEVRVTDELGTFVAHMTITGYRIGQWRGNQTANEP